MRVREPDSLLPTPRYWYCPVCGYMHMVTEYGLSPAEAEGPMLDCPACGAEMESCWQCVGAGVFDQTFCNACPSQSVCGGGNATRG